MSAWHDPDRTVIDAFLEKSQFRQGSRPTYRWFLRSFENVAQRHPAVDRQMLEVWLKEMEKRWRMPTLLNQVCIVDRFLDHLVEIGLIADNPVAVLRRQYNVKQSKPIWRALASANPDGALAALRRPAPFGSSLGDFMREHVALMRSRGYQYETQAHWLLRFDRFLQATPELTGASLETMLARWATAKLTRNHAAECQKLGRLLTKARYRLDVAHGVANAGLQALSRTLAAAGAVHGIRALSLSPGVVLNPNAPAPFNDASEPAMRALYAPAALGRPAKIKEIVEVAAFLASDKASYMTGCDIAVDGGMSGIIWRP